jgi:hypothetical protein
MLKNSKQKFKKYILGFGINNGPLSLNNNCKKKVNFVIIKLKILFINEFWWKKFEIMLIDYPHSKSTHNLEVVRF